MSKTLSALLAIFLLAACSSSEHGAGGGASEAVQPNTAAVPTRMAYSYTYRFSVPDAAIDGAQARHIAMCDQLGPMRCRVLETHRSTGEYGSASLKLEVASGVARRFGAALAPPVEALGGALLSNDVEAQDLGRQIVDVQARLRAKEALVERLNAALRTRPGSTADLVTTEKAVADAQGELDAVRSELKLAEGRLAASPFSIGYAPRQSFSWKLGNAFAAVGSTASSSVEALIYFLAAALPWAVVGVTLFFTVRAALRWLRRRRKGPLA